MAGIDISGVLVRARDDQAQRVRERLERIPGVEVHAVAEHGRLVVTVEGQGETSAVDTINRLADVEGVLATSLVYQHTDHQDPEQESAS